MISLASIFENLPQYDITSGRVHLDLWWIDQPIVDGNKHCSSIQHRFRWTRPLVMSYWGRFSKRLVRLITRLVVRLKLV